VSLLFLKIQSRILTLNFPTVNHLFPREENFKLSESVVEWYDFRLSYIVKRSSFLYRHSLSLVLLLCFALCLTGQAITGWHEHNNDLEEYHAAKIDFVSYLTTGHFIQTTFENWESEFLQMGMYVLLTIWLRQIGSSESKSLTEKEEVDREPNSKKRKAPWPVKRGGLYLALYKNSLSIAFGLLFMASYALHAYGSLVDYNEEQTLKGRAMATMIEYMKQSRFWYESFQNWQSEFIAVLSIVLLSIFLRQKGSPESKPVDASHMETGN
jgi:hypothetical protein